MNRPTFSPEIEQAIAQAFELHKQGKCEDGCGFCEDLVLSGLPSAAGELKRIHQLRLEHRKAAAPKKQQALPLPVVKRGKGKGAGLKGRVRR